MTPEGVVYVIDDDSSVRRALARLIAAAGLNVETFPSARAFLHHRLADRPACLVLDVRMPGESGLDLQATPAATCRSSSSPATGPSPRASAP
jgi:FixJ family two-component response regulator